MKKELKDYLHLYITYNERVLFIEKSNYYFVHEHSIHKGDSILLMPHIIAALDLHGKGVAVKLILRPLSSMTEEDIYEYDEIQAKGESVADTDTKFGEILVGSPECFLWLLSKHFDIFGLIDAGLAIEKK